MCIRDRLQKALIAYTHPESVNEVFAAICAAAKDYEKNTMIGFSNYIAPASIALECYKRYPDMRREQMPSTMVRVGRFHGESSGAAIVASGRIDQFFISDYSQLGFSVGRLQEQFLLEEAKAALVSSSNYRHKLLIDQGAGGYKVEVYTVQKDTNAQAQIIKR